MSEHVNHADSVKGITIHQEINFKVTPQRFSRLYLVQKNLAIALKNLLDFH